MTITIGGKPITGTPEAPKRVGKHRQLTTAQITQRHPAEPFPPVDSFRTETVEHRLSVASEVRCACEIEESHDER